MFKGWEYDVSGIGEELGVTYVLKGQVTLVEKDLSISAQLIKAERNRRVWAGSYKGQLKDLFALNDEVFNELLGALGTDTGVHLVEAKATGGTNDLDAFIDYTLGRYYWLNNEAPSIVKGVEHLQAAVKADTAYALAYAALADAYAVMGYLGVVQPKPAFESCGMAAQRALALDGNLSEAHAAMGWKRFLYDWDWAGAEKELRLAVDLHPDNANARYRYASFLLAMGRLEEARAEIEAARPLSPLQPLLSLTLGDISLAAGEYKRAKHIYEEIVESNPSYLLGYAHLVQAYWALGENGSALRLLAEGSESAGTSELTLSLLGQAWGRIQMEENATGILDELAARSEKVYVSSYNQALIYLGLGEKDKTIEYLRKAVEERYPRVCYLKAMPMWKDLEDDPRYQEILAAVGLNR